MNLTKRLTNPLFRNSGTLLILITLLLCSEEDKHKDQVHLEMQHRSHHSAQQQAAESIREMQYHKLSVEQLEQELSTDIGKVQQLRLNNSEKGSNPAQCKGEATLLWSKRANISSSNIKIDSFV